MKDITLVSHLQSLGRPPAAPAAKPQGSGFADFLQDAVKDANRLQVAADRAVEGVQTGENHNLHEAMISMEKADISLRLVVQLRNKVVEAYQEIMRLQV